MQIFNALQIVKQLLRLKLTTAQVIVDATAGNGHDTLYLAEQSLPTAQVFAFDVQAEAVEQTKLRLQAAGLIHKAKVINANHNQLTAYVQEPIDIALFNLGYLPGTDHRVTTTSVTTLAAVQQTLRSLARQGILVLVVYPGHAEGKQEAETLAVYLPQLPSSTYTVSCWKMINHSERAPFVYIVEKVRSEVREGITSR